MKIILLAFAFVFFTIATFAVVPPPPAPAAAPWTGRFNFIAAGLAVWVLVDLLASIPALHSFF